METPLIITVALTGNVPTKSMTPYVPITPEEIADDVEKCYKLGAVLFHIHARDSEEKPCLDLNIYRKTVKLIKEKCPEAIIQLSTGARAGKDPLERCNVIRLCPEMGSFATGSNNLAKIIYENSPAFILQLAKTFKDTGVKPEIECFDAGHMNNAIFLAKRKKAIPEPLHFNFVLGTAGGIGGTVKSLQHLADQVPQGSTWTVTGVGKIELQLAAAAIGMGGHVRVGVEDNIFLPDGKLASNEELVKRVVSIAEQVGRKIATPDQARKILNLPIENKNKILHYLDPNVPLAPVDLTSVGIPITPGTPMTPVSPMSPKSMGDLITEQSLYIKQLEKEIQMLREINKSLKKTIDEETAQKIEEEIQENFRKGKTVIKQIPQLDANIILQLNGKKIE